MTRIPCSYTLIGMLLFVCTLARKPLVRKATDERFKSKTDLSLGTTENDVSVLGPCRKKILMFDSRGVDMVENYSSGSDSYWKKVAAINFLYAVKHGYDFTYLHMKDKDKPPHLAAWPPQALHPDVLYGELTAFSPQCHVFYAFDTDVVPSDMSVPLDAVQHNMTQQLCNTPLGETTCPDLSFVVEQDDGTSAVKLNIGVLVFSSGSQNIFKKWIGAIHNPDNALSRGTWPFEQGVLEDLLDVHSVDPKDAGVKRIHNASIGVMRTRTMNTPNGAFLKHISGDKSKLRETVFDTMLESLGINHKDGLNGVLNYITSSSQFYHAPRFQSA